MQIIKQKPEKPFVVSSADSTMKLGLLLFLVSKLTDKIHKPYLPSFGGSLTTKPINHSLREKSQESENRPERAKAHSPGRARRGKRIAHRRRTALKGQKRIAQGKRSKAEQRSGTLGYAVHPNAAPCKGKSVGARDWAKNKGKTASAICATIGQNRIGHLCNHRTKRIGRIICFCPYRALFLFRAYNQGAATLALGYALVAPSGRFSAIGAPRFCSRRALIRPLGGGRVRRAPLPTEIAPAPEGVSFT